MEEASDIGCSILHGILKVWYQKDTFALHELKECVTCIEPMCLIWLILIITWTVPDKQLLLIVFTYLDIWWAVIKLWNEFR